MEWIRRLRMRQLAILIAMHDSRNLSRTANRMAMSQPALSKWLREFEKDLGVMLFERHSRGLVPTPYCEVLVSRARMMLNELDRTAELLQVMSEGLSGKLNLGATPTAVTDLVPAALALFHRRYPRASVSIREDYLEQLLPDLLDGRLDLIASRLEDRSYGPDLVQERLYSEQLFVISGKKHPLARRKTVAWKEALSFPWIGPPASSPLQRELENELALARQPLPRFVMEASSMVLIASVLERTEMLAVMSGRPAHYFDQLGALRILPVRFQRHNFCGVLWRKGGMPGELEAGLLECLRAAARGSAEAG
ncbi:MAG: LysR family transcriptional regulator [Noviherbaspirillum sp.]